MSQHNPSDSNIVHAPLEHEGVVEHISSRQKLHVAVGASALAAAGILAGYHVSPEVNNFINSGLDAGITPDVPVFDQITHGMSAIADGLRTVAPAAAVSTGMAYLGVNLAKRGDRQWIRMRKMAATSSYSDSYSSHEHSESLLSRSTARVRKALAGTALAAMVIITATAGIEHEVAEGPARAVDQTVQLLGADGHESYIFAQNKGAMLMNNSYVPRDPANRAVEMASARGMAAMPFNRELVDLRTESGKQMTSLVLGVPESAFEKITDKPFVPASDCGEISVIADKAAAVNLDDQISLNDQPARVIAGINNLSSMNRVGIIASEKDVAECLQKDTDAPYYGVVISGELDEVKRLTEETGLTSHGSLLSIEQVNQNNKKFWQANGTPILLQMMGYIVGFGFIANRNERRAALQYDIKELGMLQATGVQLKQIRTIENLRALHQTAVAAVVAAPLAPVFAAVVNAAERGLQVGVTLREVAVGFSLTLAAKVFGARRAFKRFSKDLTPSEAMRG